jgi:hypothetical protein
MLAGLHPGLVSLSKVNWAWFSTGGLLPRIGFGFTTLRSRSHAKYASVCAPILILERVLSFQPPRWGLGGATVFKSKRCWRVYIKLHPRSKSWTSDVFHLHRASDTSWLQDWLRLYAMPPMSGGFQPDFDWIYEL